MFEAAIRMVTGLSSVSPNRPPARTRRSWQSDLRSIFSRRISTSSKASFSIEVAPDEPADSFYEYLRGGWQLLGIEQCRTWISHRCLQRIDADSSRYYLNTEGKILRGLPRG
jgi:hypothetical protein